MVASQTNYSSGPWETKEKWGTTRSLRKIRLLILTRFLCSEKGNTVFTDLKDRQVQHYYPTKKAVILSTGSGQKEILMAQRNQHLSFNFFIFIEFFFMGYHFCNWCCSSNSWDYLAIVLAGLSETVSFLKTLGHLYDAFEIRQKVRLRKK